MAPGVLFGIKVGEKILEAGSAWIRKRWPDPAEAAKREAELADIVNNIDMQQIGGLRDFILEYEGKAADIHPLMQVYRGSVRPTLTYYLVGLLTYAIIEQKSIDVIQFIFTLNLLSMGFWYGERALSKLGINSQTITGVFGKKPESD